MTLPLGIPGLGVCSLLSVWGGGGGIDVVGDTTAWHTGAWGSFSSLGMGGRGSDVVGDPTAWHTGAWGLFSALGMGEGE